jgi:O-antigen ligase
VPTAAPIRGARKLPRLALRPLLPALLFLAFFASNTQIGPWNTLMLRGRWPALLAICGLAFLLSSAPGRGPRQPPPLVLALLGAFAAVGVTLPYSSNPLISGAKWGVFLIFLLFCALYFGAIRDRNEAVRTIEPLSWIFVIFIWTTPLGVMFFYQKLVFLGYVNGYLRFPNALGQFLVLFGLPVVLYRLETARGTKSRLFFGATTLLALYYTFACGSRTSGFIAILFLGIAFLRWRGLRGRFGTPFKVIAVLGAFLLLPGYQDQILTFVYKYPGVHSLLESRADYWAATEQSFGSRPWFGSGFGVQEAQAEAELSFETRGEFREQGNAYLGMLEEVGMMGAVPVFLVLVAIGFRYGLLLVRTRDPLDRLFSRSVIAGLLWGMSENYLLYLGNAASILFFFSFFLGERLLLLKRRERVAARNRALALHWRRRVHFPGFAGAP